MCGRAEKTWHMLLCSNLHITALMFNDGGNLFVELSKMVDETTMSIHFFHNPGYWMIFYSSTEE